MPRLRGPRRSSLRACSSGTSRSSRAEARTSGARRPPSSSRAVLEVVIAGRRTDVLEQTGNALGPQCSWVSGDIRVVADCERIVDVALERHGRVDTLLNNAGGQYFSAAEAITQPP